MYHSHVLVLYKSLLRYSRELPSFKLQYNIRKMIKHQFKFNKNIRQEFIEMQLRKGCQGLQILKNINHEHQTQFTKNYHDGCWPW